MRRKLKVNWDEEHGELAFAAGEGVEDPYGVNDCGKGWSYVTFFEAGVRPQSVLFDVEGLDRIAHDNGYFLPLDVMMRHNKVVVTAHSALPQPSAQLYALYLMLQRYEKEFDHAGRFPNLGFYGKLGGFFDRPEKGRALVIYATSDDALLEIDERLDGLLPRMKLRGITFEKTLSNGLSDIPRLLQGYGDPDYREAGAQHCRITDPARFEQLLDQARVDYTKYLFEHC